MDWMPYSFIAESKDEISAEKWYLLDRQYAYGAHNNDQ
jgi:hypothetical protein